jgi:hypothetical protein
MNLGMFIFTTYIAYPWQGVKSSETFVVAQTGPKVLMGNKILLTLTIHTV